MLHLYIGDGKGKTTAALGLALRACGAGKRVYFAQFLKDSAFTCGEALPLKQAGIVFDRFKGQVHPLFDKQKNTASITRRSIAAALAKINKLVAARKFDLIVLDEILNAVSAGLIGPDVLCALVKSAVGIELVLTGRSADAKIKKHADYISLIKKIKHPFDKNVLARRGIEY